MTRKRERRFWSAVCFIGAAAIFAGSASAQQAAGDADPVTQPPPPDLDAAVAVVHRLQDALIASSRYPDVAERVELLRDEVAATHDLAYIGELTVRRSWRSFTNEQRSEFVNGFAALSVMSYAARFVDVDDGSFALHGAEDIGNGRVQVRSGIARADGSTVPLDYVLQDGPEGWRIVNVIADGVSDIALKRAEYRALLDERGFTGLLEELAEQTEDLAESASR